MSGNGAQSTIVVDSVSRWFAGVVAVSDVSLMVEPGVTALLGPNGAGKTTLLRAIAGLIATSQGTVRIFGEPVRGNPGLYRRIGYMTEHESVYDFLTGRQFVELNARLQGVEDLRGAVERAIETVDLVDAQNRRLREYSRGMRQRMRLAATLVHDPPLLLLDEPLSGTDPAQRLHLQDVIRRFGAEGRTIVVSSHILEEVDKFADRIHLMVSGKLAASGDYRAIRQQLNDRPFLVRIDSSDARALAAGLLTVEAVESVEVDREGHLRVRSVDVAALQRSLPAVAARLDIRLFRVEPLDDSLESVFEYLATGSAT
ncbi:MAG TPA: ABC transporter ATP-binding protein [Gaiellaceae bacterium]